MSHQALGPQHHEQLKMFMTHDEIGDLESNDYPGYKVRDTGGQVLLRDEYKQRGRNYEYIRNMIDAVDRQGGVETPVAVLNNNTLMNGHHRYLASVGPTGRPPSDRLIPVIHDDDRGSLLHDSWGLERRQRGRRV